MNLRVNTGRPRVLSWIALALLSSIVLLSVALQAVRALTTGWATTYDDAYISFRYADNLAQGFGLVWNPGMAPTEGYSNLLLVLLLAPAMRLGADPLMATRLISLAVIVAVMVTLYLVGRRTYSAGRAGALVAAFTFAVVPGTLPIALIGMETTLYSGMMLWTLLSGVDLIARGRTRDAVLFALLGIAGVLVRPDAAIVLLVVLVAWALMALRKRCSWKAGLLAAGLLVAFAVPYALWKVAYFGDWLPNPFYIKSDSTGVSDLGLASVLAFLGGSTFLLLLASIGALTAQASSVPLATLRDDVDAKRRRLYATLGGVTILLTLCFYAMTDTLMDIEGRFLYPLTPVVILIAIPAISALVRMLGYATLRQASYSFVAVIAFFLLITGIPPASIRAELNPSRVDALRQAFSLPRTISPQWELAERLRGLPGVRQTKIAYGDAGIVPYLTGAQWLDPVGLNDSFIARSRDKSALVDYFFAQAPDIVLLPSDHNGGWITYGHGPLGDYTSWTADARWSQYEYVGTDDRTDTPYDLEFLVRRDSPQFTSLKDYLRASVIDGWWSSLPHSLGGVPGDPSAVWTARQS